MPGIFPKLLMRLCQLLSHPLGVTMTQNEFVALCREMLIAPAIALECEAVVKALKTKDPKAVRKALEENF